MSGEEIVRAERICGSRSGARTIGPATSCGNSTMYSETSTMLVVGLILRR
jgi:hypothetical protein